MNMIVLPYLVDFALGRTGEGHAVVLELDDGCRRFLGHVVDGILLKSENDTIDTQCSSDVPPICSSHHSESIPDLRASQTP